MNDPHACVRRQRATAVLTAALGLTLGLTLGLLSPAAASPASADDQPSSASRAAAPPEGAQRTRLTFAVPGCEGCRIQLHRVRETEDVKHPHTWHSRNRRVVDGEVTFDLRSRRTFGMTATVVAPWEGHTGYLTTVAFRYAGKSVGEQVTFRQARHQRRASACWEGTRRDAVTIPLVVRRVRVQGVQERVPGSIAYTPSTQAWLSPMRRAFRGVLGSQDFDVCR
ncbi:hypothetical protein [Nocardioides sp.]|uniref:hypothetical protein n=1 Tax=Nocardioides sp. TaxID=35761 RepID=UPI0035626C77